MSMCKITVTDAISGPISKLLYMGVLEDHLLQQRS